MSLSYPLFFSHGDATFKTNFDSAIATVSTVGEWYGNPIDKRGL